MCDCKNEKEIIAKDLIAYLHDHPDAQDTLEGIVGWWLLEQKIKHGRELVGEVLSELVKDGWLLETTKQQTNYYKLGKAPFGRC